MKETVNDMWKKLDKAENCIMNWVFGLEIILQNNEQADKINQITDEILSLDTEITDNELLTLYALKLYTEHKVTWEKAGSISGKHIFGLQEYCNERDVDWGNLRIDEYYNITDPKVIEEEWSKLDPEGKVAPVEFDMESNVTFKSNQEYTNGHLQREHYTATARYVLTEFILIYNDTINLFDDDYSDYKQQVNYLRRIAKRLKILKKEELEVWVNTLEDSYSLLRKAIDEEDKYFHQQSFENLYDKINDGYYTATIKT